jgi:hypothetical protein
VDTRNAAAASEGENIVRLSGPRPFPRRNGVTKPVQAPV